MAAVSELTFGTRAKKNSKYVNKIEKVKKSSSILNFHNDQQGAQAKMILNIYAVILRLPSVGLPLDATMT